MYDDVLSIALQLLTVIVAKYEPSSRCVAAHISAERFATRTKVAKTENPAMPLRQPGK
jgi:hypothetical protein